MRTQKFDHVTASYYRGSSGALICFDLGRPNTSDKYGGGSNHRCTLSKLEVNPILCVTQASKVGRPGKRSGNEQSF
jgi:GTPase SAR1 family protein